MSRTQQNRIGLLLIAPALALAGACGPGEARDQPEGSQEAEAVETAPTIPSGTLISLRLLETVSTDTHAAGDAVAATVTDPVHGADGTVLVPSGARMGGVVERSVRSSGPEDPAVLAFHFDRLYVGDESYPVTATVESAEARQTEGDSGAETAAKIAIGTAAGALLGQVLGGDTESTLKGAAAGTVAGAVVAITSRQGDATLEQGSTVTIRTQEAIRLD